jgi:lipopolysaccharide transport system permease protein/teichoic acid transport system permease protein
VENYRNILMHGTSPDFVPLTIIFILSLAVIIFMLYFYSKNEHKIIKAL